MTSAVVHQGSAGAWLEGIALLAGILARAGQLSYGVRDAPWGFEANGMPSCDVLRTQLQTGVVLLWALSSPGVERLL